MTEPLPWIQTVRRANGSIGGWVSCCNSGRSHQTLDMMTPAKAGALAA